jgi:hypothetical protein
MIGRKFHADDEKTKNLEFGPMHPKNVLLASVVHVISCLFEDFFLLIILTERKTKFSITISKLFLKIYSTIIFQHFNITISYFNQVLNKHIDGIFVYVNRVMNMKNDKNCESYEKNVFFYEKKSFFLNIWTFKLRAPISAPRISKTRRKKVVCAYKR